MKRTAPTVLALALALVVGGCGAADDVAEKAVEKGIEKAAERDGVADMELDTDTGEMTIEGEDGAVLMTSHIHSTGEETRVQYMVGAPE